MLTASPQCTELVLLSFSVVLSQLTSFAVENGSRQTVPILAAVELGERPPAFGLVIDRRQNVNRLINAADLGHSLGQFGGPVANLQSSHD